MGNGLLWGAIGLAAVGGGILLARGLKKNTEEYEKEFNHRTLERIYDLIAAECENTDKDKILELLDDCITNKKDFTKPLPDIHKIEYVFEKESPSLMQCELAVAFKLKTAEKVIIRKIRHQLEWHQLPDRIREDFIMSGEDKRGFQIYEAGAYS